MRNCGGILDRHSARGFCGRFGRSGDTETGERLEQDGRLDLLRQVQDLHPLPAFQEIEHVLRELNRF